MSRWYFRRKALKCFILDIGVIIVPFLIWGIDYKDEAMTLALPFCVPTWFVIVPILSCKYIYKGFKESQMGAFEYIKTAFKRGLSEKYLIIRGMIVITIVGLFIGMFSVSAAYHELENNRTVSKNQSDRMFSNQPPPEPKLQVKQGTKCCAMCMYFNGSMGCRTMEKRLGDIYVCNRNEEGSCFSMGIKVKAWHGMGCQNFISRY